MSAFTVTLENLPKRLRQAFRAVTLLLRRPAELDSTVRLAARYLWNVELRRRQLLVVERSGGMGDLVCLLASLRGIKTRHPDAWLVLICPPGCWQLAAVSGLCDAASDTKSIFHQFVVKACAPCRYYRPQLPDDDSPPEPRRLHLAEEFAVALRVNVDFSSVSFSPTSSARRRVVARLRKVNPHQRPIVVMHAGPAWPVREWPIDCWAELSDKLGLTESVTVIQIGTDLEAGRGMIRPLRIPRTVNWVNTLDLVELVALFELTDVYIGIDSGPLHVAAAIGVPSVGLFGPTLARLILRPQAKITIITGSSNCIGCHHSPTGPLHWHTGCPNNIICMQEITPEQVRSAVSECLRLKPVKTVSR
jgi:ADP-heptose:LPS heptosyltransferase